MLSRIVAASLRRNGRRVPAIGSPTLLGDVLPPLQWDRMFSSETTEGGDQGQLLPSFACESISDDDVKRRRRPISSSTLSFLAQASLSPFATTTQTKKNRCLHFFLLLNSSTRSSGSSSICGLAAQAHPQAHPGRRGLLGDLRRARRPPQGRRRPPSARGRQPL